MTDPFACGRHTPLIGWTKRRFKLNEVNIGKLCGGRKIYHYVLHNGITKQHGICKVRMIGFFYALGT